eukprot:sb/3475909/
MCKAADEADKDDWYRHPYTEESDMFGRPSWLPAWTLPPNQRAAAVTAIPNKAALIWSFTRATKVWCLRVIEDSELAQNQDMIELTEPKKRTTAKPPQRPTSKKPYGGEFIITAHITAQELFT